MSFSFEAFTAAFAILGDSDAVKPWRALGAHAATVLDANIYPTVTAQLVAPALVIRPDQPWREPGGTFCREIQNYVAVAVVAAATPDDGTDVLFDMTSQLIETLPEGWDLTNVSGIVLDESTGHPLLATAIRLRHYWNGEEES